MKIQDAYDCWAETYDIDRNLTRDLDQSVTRDALGNQRYASILEIGCGTGKNTSLLAEIGENVLALDFSFAMIKKAKAKLSSSHVSFALADLSKPWPCRDQTADFISINLVLEHVRDLHFIFSEASRTLVHAGRLFISELHPFRQYEGVRARFDRGSEKIEIPAFVHHLSEYIDAARINSLSLRDFKETWHDEDQDKRPRLVSFLFEKK